MSALLAWDTHFIYIVSTSVRIRELALSSHYAGFQYKNNLVVSTRKNPVVIVELSKSKTDYWNLFESFAINQFLPPVQWASDAYSTFYTPVSSTFNIGKNPR